MQFLIWFANPSQSNGCMKDYQATCFSGLPWERPLLSKSHSI